ncbi:Chemotaxis protein methyltransferase CheR [Labilithrix luteola]|uniref:histidine kinase n=1 Tax=Labilithrix luteola TaxID=1391654 RepID=A0A0K1QFG7_9BACT|nr:response regulator [Labilithrix luteola]AKV04521.1 Chemotaxis protein methyltransferase CheR [Labilithrix luteola]
MYPNTPSTTASILLVADHLPNLEALRAILEPLGERVVCASSGAEAVIRASHEDFALVLLDLRMPELDGLEAAALLKKADRSRAVPVILLTPSEPTSEVVAKSFSTGDEFLHKPVDPEVLRTKAAAAVARYRQRMAPRASDSRIAADPTTGRLSERLIAALPVDAQADAVEALVRIHSALNGELDLGRIAQRLIDETTSLTSASGGAFHYAVGKGARSHQVSGCSAMDVALSGMMDDEMMSLGPECPQLQGVFCGVSILRLSAPFARSAGVPSRVGSLIAVPVVSRDGETTGAIVLAHEDAGAFDVRDEELAAVAAQHAAGAFENARLYEEAKEARHRAELAELELRAGEARRRIALESAGLGTWDYNPMTGALRWDARSKALSGLGPGAMVSIAVWMAAVHADDRARVERAVRRALDPMTSGAFDCEYRTVGLEDSIERWVAAKGQAIVEQGSTVRFIGTLLDITASKRIEEERAALLAREQDARAEAEVARARAEAASRAKDEFLATVSHELRNPLNAILGWSRVLLESDDELSHERRRKGLEVVARNARAQVQLVDDILDVSRIVSGKLRLSTGLVDVRMAVESCLDTVRSAAQAKGVLLESEFEDEPGSIVADQDRIQQILWNLASNAVKFTPRGGVVRIAAKREADAVVLTVNDTGEGIDAAFLPFVFDRFRQADGSTTRLHGGLGLGLAIVRHLTELHGGTVQAESAGLGHGAKFTVCLPLFAALDADTDGDKRRRSPGGSSGSEPVQLSPLAGFRVLVLDDEEDMRDLIAMILEHAGAKVTRVPTVEDAMRSLEACVPDVALSDLAMPIEDGFVFVQRVRSATNEGVRQVPLVAMTAYARAEDRQRVLAAGFQRHVAKPIKPAELVSVLRELARA